MSVGFGGVRSALSNGPSSLFVPDGQSTALDLSAGEKLPEVIDRKLNVNYLWISCHDGVVAIIISGGGLDV